MSGAEHYRKAERLVDQLEQASSGGRGVPIATGNATLALAQVHATLALAGVTAVCNGLAWHDQSAAADWRTALGIAEAPQQSDAPW